MNSDIKLSVYVPSLPPIIYFLARPEFLDDPPPLPPQTHFLNLYCVPALITHIFPFFVFNLDNLEYEQLTVS